MNIHPCATASPFAPPGWTMQCSFENVGSTCQCICVVFRDGVLMCSISMTDTFGDREAAQLAAAERARAWIAAFLARPSDPPQEA